MQCSESFSEPAKKHERGERGGGARSIHRKRERGRERVGRERERGEKERPPCDLYSKHKIVKEKGKERRKKESE